MQWSGPQKIHPTFKINYNTWQVNVFVIETYLVEGIKTILLSFLRTLQIALMLWELEYILLDFIFYLKKHVYPFYHIHGWHDFASQSLVFPLQIRLSQDKCWLWWGHCWHDRLEMTICQLRHLCMMTFEAQNKHTRITQTIAVTYSPCAYGRCILCQVWALTNECSKNDAIHCVKVVFVFPYYRFMYLFNTHPCGPCLIASSFKFGDTFLDFDIFLQNEVDDMCNLV